MKLRVGVAGASEAVMAAIAVVDSDINQLHRKLQSRENDRRSLLQGGKQEKTNKKQ